MARLVRRTPTGPTSFKIDGEEKWFCKCGLSKNQPFCDGSHKLTRGEEPGKLYWYDDAGVRHEVPDDGSCPRSGRVAAFPAEAPRRSGTFRFSPAAVIA